MQRVLARRGFLHTLSDCYANDPWISDAAYISKTLLANAVDGSILVIHAPERGFREYNLKALRLALEGLRERGLKAVTLGELHRAAHANLQASSMGTCPSGHELQLIMASMDGWTCNRCSSILNAGSSLYGCRTCNWDLCKACHCSHMDEAPGAH